MRAVLGHLGIGHECRQPYMLLQYCLDMRSPVLPSDLSFKCTIFASYFFSHSLFMNVWIGGECVSTDLYVCVFSFRLDSRKTGKMKKTFAISISVRIKKKGKLFIFTVFPHYYNFDRFFSLSFILRSEGALNARWMREYQVQPNTDSKLGALFGRYKKKIPPKCGRHCRPCQRHR